MNFCCDRVLFAVLVRCPVHTPVCTPIYGLPLNQSDRRFFSVFQLVCNNILLLTGGDVSARIYCPWPIRIDRPKGGHCGKG